MNSPEWMRAALLVAQGERAEAAQWLAAYARQNPQHEAQSAYQWLLAQTYAERERRLSALRRVARSFPPEDRYGRMAREALAIEERYHTPVVSPWRRRALVAGLVVLAVGALLWGAVNLFGTPAPVVAELPTELPPATVTAVPTATLPPSREQLVSLPSVHYGAGVLRVVAIEDGAQAVVSREGVLAQPIDGAQFYTVRLRFECRLAICNEPPQAALQLAQADDFRFEPRRDVRAVGDPGFPAVALGIESEGVLVFEIPTIGVPARLMITPLNDAETPLALDLMGVP